MDEEPELRSGPPWIMEDMISAQLELPDALSAQGDAQRLGDRVRSAVRDGEPVLFTGCGTSEHAARAAHAMLKDVAPGARSAARDAFEAQLDPPDCGLLVAISHGGRTRSTVLAAQRALAAGARVCFLTARPEHAPAGVDTCATPLRDRSWCHTIGYTSALLACATLRPDRAKTIMRAEIDARTRLREAAVRLRTCRRLLIVGSGIDEITASELALKIEEAAHMPATPLGAEKVLHGHLPACDEHTGIVLLRFDPRDDHRRDERTADVANAAAVLSMPAVTLATPRLASRAEALLAGALALQLLTLELALAHATNPDLIRREDPLYRRAAEVAAVE